MVTGIASPVPGRTWAYSYDGLDRLTFADNAAGSADDRSFAYDAAGNMTWNSGLCAASPNLTYPTQGAGAVRPHAPTAICGVSVGYDANGNTTAYDVDGAGSLQPRSIAYDGENRPTSVIQNGNLSRFEYGPSGARSQKVFGSAARFLFGGEELLVDGANPSGLLTSVIDRDVRREGGATDFLVKDRKASTRSTITVTVQELLWLPVLPHVPHPPVGHPLPSSDGRGRERWDYGGLR
jgi:hypothetical protein